MKNYKTSFLFSIKIPAFFICIFLLALISCRKKNYASATINQSVKTTNKPDYSKLYYWAAHPWKKDASDSVPKPLRYSYHPDSSVDVFFLHPTTLTNSNDKRWNAPINDTAINNKTDRSTILYQASVFNEQCRVFAPRYRQAHIKAFFIDTSESEKYFDTAYEDIRAGFIYYLEHFNGGRPIIIASHSQGTKHAARLLKEFFDNKSLKNKLVCAYIIGLPVPENYFATIPVCKDSTSTGCFVSWRTFKRGYTEPEFIAKENFKAVIINPLSWTADTGLLSSKYNSGGVLLKFNKIIPHVVNANIHNNVLWTSKPNIAGKILFTKKNYHVGDINLFYMNIRQNVKTRIGAFWKQ
ncbi:DUF3089 domain-containing protein [Ferruginibacter sp. SUN106]|uniref:DUF3089 domain-containing protein n=1 Tax=Ferruginibacter sp. SUN106 TaxID=2978348 RepID=UPI003D36C1C9